MASKVLHRQLAEVAFITSGKRPASVTKERSGKHQIPVIGGGGESGFTQQSLYSEDILITGRVGTLGKLFSPKGPCWPSDNALVIRPKGDAVHFQYLKYALGSVISSAAGMNRGAANPLITQTDLGRLEIPVPEKSTQAQIAMVLGRLDEKIDVSRRISQTLEAIAQATFKSWFVDFDPVKAKIAAKQEGRDPLRASMSAISGKQDAEFDALSPEQYDQLAVITAMFPDEMEESELGEIPKGWSVKSIGDVARFTSGKVKTSSLSEENYISTENMLENRGGVVRASSLPSVATVPSFAAGQVLISNIRPYFKKIWMARFDGGRSPDVLAFAPAAPKWPEFLYSLMYQDSFFEFMTRTAKGAKMPRGDKDAIIGWKFPCPSEVLMTYFSEKVRPHHKLIESLTSENKSLAELRDTLLPKLLSGELSVTEAMVDAEA
ncbi:MAG: restriction endonuclease subunit S [Pseudomonadota bacterium]